jgi:hypothetical protein
VVHPDVQENVVDAFEGVGDVALNVIDTGSELVQSLPKAIERCVYRCSSPCLHLLLTPLVMSFYLLFFECLFYDLAHSFICTVVHFLMTGL